MELFACTPSRAAWGLLAVSALVVVAAGAALGFTVSDTEVWAALALVCGLLALSAIGRHVVKSEPMAEISALFAFWVAMLSVLLPASYIAAGFDAAPVDGVLQHLDRAVGLDWPAFIVFTQRHDLLSQVFVWAYTYSVVQILIAVLTLAARRDIARLNVYITTLLLATVATIVLSAAFPAAGGYRTYGFSPDPHGGIARLVNVDHYLADFDAVRAGTLRHLDGRFDGIIQFPSFHTVVAVTAAWAVWHFPRLGPMSAAISVLVLVTTLPIGGHHLMDVFGGIAVSALALWAARRIEARVGSPASAMGALGAAQPAI